MPRLHVGGTRYVLLIGPLAFKVPRVDCGGRQFVLGLLANINERHFSRCAETEGDRRLARTYFAAPLGLLAVAERCPPPIGRLLTRDEVLGLPLVEFSGECGVDDTGRNVSRRDDGTLVVIDYGNPGLMYDPAGPRMYRGVERSD